MAVLDGRFTDLPRIPRRGDDISAKVLGTAAKYLNDVAGNLGEITQFTDNPVRIVRLLVRVEDVKDNYLVCKRWNTTDLDVFGDDVNAAKPYLLRVDPFKTDGRNGFTYTYEDTHIERTSTETSSSDTETQVIVPDWVEGEDLIIIERGIIGGTGVTDDSGFPVVWQDANVDARQWGKKAT